jgi:hypothetical protein
MAVINRPTGDIYGNIASFIGYIFNLIFFWLQYTKQTGQSRGRPTSAIIVGSRPDGEPSPFPVLLFREKQKNS